MSVLTEVREELAALLYESSEFPAYSYLPKLLTAPASIVTPGSPYVTSGRGVGGIEVALRVRLLVLNKDNQTATESLDSALDAVLVALITAKNELGNTKYSVDEVTEPFMFGNANGPQYLTAEISITTQTTL